MFSAVGEVFIQHDLSSPSPSTVQAMSSVSDTLLTNEPVQESLKRTWKDHLPIKVVNEFLPLIIRLCMCSSFPQTSIAARQSLCVGRVIHKSCIKEINIMNVNSYLKQISFLIRKNYVLVFLDRICRPLLLLNRIKLFRPLSLSCTTCPELAIASALDAGTFQRASGAVKSGKPTCRLSDGLRYNIGKSFLRLSENCKRFLHHINAGTYPIY